MAQTWFMIIVLPSLRSLTGGMSQADKEVDGGRLWRKGGLEEGVCEFGWNEKAGGQDRAQLYDLKKQESDRNLV